MTESLSSLDGFLTEFKATLSQPSGAAVLRRINAERLLSLIAEEFVASHEAERIRILPDNRVAGPSGSDFLLQIDDYDIRIEFLDAPDGQLSIEPYQAGRLILLLHDNPNTVAVVLVWTTDELLSLAVDENDLTSMANDAHNIESLLSCARPLLDVLREVVASQTRQWDVGFDKINRMPTQPPEMRRVFERAIGLAIEAERERPYRYAQRKQAAAQFPVDQERQLILSTLADALDEAPLKDLVAHLTRLPRRGGK